MDRIRKTIKWFAGIGAEEVIRTLLWPGIITGAGVLIGWLEEFSLFYIYIGSIFLLAASTHWLLRLSEWRDKNRVQYKIIFSHGIVRLHIDEKTKKVLSVCLGAEFKNNAEFQIICKLNSIRTQLTDINTGEVYYAPNKERGKTEIKYPAGSTGIFRDHHIDISSLNKANLVGDIDAEISYFRHSRKMYTMAIKKKAYFDLAESGISGGNIWYDG